jgi:hypothetical protein
VYSLPKFEMDELTEKGYYDGDIRGRKFLKKNNERDVKRHILQCGKFLQDLPNHLSTHAASEIVYKTVYSIREFSYGH